MKTNLLICDEDRKLYFISRIYDGQVYNRLKSAVEPYVEKKRKQYAQYPKYAGGGIFIFPEAYDNLLVIFEQQGKKPDKSDKIIETFGIVKIVKQTDP